MNKKGFTLVEVIAVIALLGLLIGLAVPGIMRSSEKAKQRTLNTKIKNIEKAAVIYGQDNRGKFNGTTCSQCTGKTNCKCFDSIITVGTLADPDNNPNTKDYYIEYDDKVNKTILNSTDESKTLNGCEIQIYQKYGKIYAVYTKTITGNNTYNENCWVN